MIMNSTATLCLGNFMRQELKSVLARYDVDGFNTAADSPVLQTELLACAVEMVILRTLSTFCDADTSDHAQRLVYLAEATGCRMHLSPADLSLLRLAALVHDIGKVAIPTAVLQKPCALDAAERSLVCLHPQIGEQILLAAGGLFAQLAPIVVAHHEYWDGSGYPQALLGDAIPLSARILAVVDSFDAMIFYRAYREPFSISSACAELQRCAGSQFDPYVVSTFLTVLEEQVSYVRFHVSTFSSVDRYPSDLTLLGLKNIVYP